MNDQDKLPQKAHMYNGLALAYMGDAIYETYVRQHLLAKGMTKVQHLHRTATAYVSAKAQAAILSVLLEEGFFTERELDLVRRGRNANPGTVPKHTDLAIYRLSTAFECVLGYLFLDEQQQRLEELITKSFSIVEEQ